MLSCTILLNHQITLFIFFISILTYFYNFPLWSLKLVIKYICFDLQCGFFPWSVETLFITVINQYTHIYKYYYQIICILQYRGPGGSMSQVVGSNNKPITNTAWVRAQLCKLQKKWCTRLATASDQVYQLLVQGRWFSPGTPASPTTKTGCHDIAEILLEVALNTKNSNSYCNKLGATTPSRINLWIHTRVFNKCHLMNPHQFTITENYTSFVSGLESGGANFRIGQESGGKLSTNKKIIWLQTYPFSS